MKTFIVMTILSFNVAYGSTIIGKSLNGTGCENSNSSMTTSPDGEVISVLFDNFSVEIPNSPPFIRGVHLGETKTIKHCNISFTLSIEEDEYVESVEVINDIRGLVFLDDDIKTTFKSEVLKKPVNNQFGRSPRKEIISFKGWNGFLDKDIFLNEETTLSFRQTCGKKEKLDFKFRNTLAIEMSRTSLLNGNTGFVAIDSIDSRSNIKFRINYKKCPSRNVRIPQRNDSRSSRMDRVKMICERNGGRLIGTRCVF